MENLINGFRNGQVVTHYYKDTNDTCGEYINTWEQVVKQSFETRKSFKELDIAIKNANAKKNAIDSIQKVIFNKPATIVIWADGTKTIVKSEGEKFDPEKGLAMAISKRLLGNNQGYYYEVFKKWVPEKKKQTKKK